jgi:hypothetical protein
VSTSPSCLIVPWASWMTRSVMCAWGPSTRCGRSHRTFPDLTKAVLELLATYLRESRMNYSDALPPADVREIMRLVRERIGDER